MAQARPFYTENLGTPLRVAQVIGLTSTAFLAGTTFGASFVAAPALLQAPAPLLVKQWKKLYETDKLLAPVIALFSTGIFAYISYRDNAWTKPSILYAASASLSAALVPYTILFGEPSVKKLEEKGRSLADVSLSDTSAEASISKKETAHKLVDQWALISFGRFAISALSATLATWAAVDRTEVVPATAGLFTGANRMGN